MLALDREYCATLTLYGRNDLAAQPTTSNTVCASVMNVDLGTQPDGGPNDADAGIRPPAPDAGADVSARLDLGVAAETDAQPNGGAGLDGASALEGGPGVDGASVPPSAASRSGCGRVVGAAGGSDQLAVPFALAGLLALARRHLSRRPARRHEAG